MSASDQHVVIVGGGISGLTTAWRLLRDPELLATNGPAARPFRDRLRVTVLEASDRPGGSIRSERDGGFLVEWAANGFLDSATETLNLCRHLNLENRLHRANRAAMRRFVFTRGRLREIPNSPISFLRSDTLTPPGRLRALMEPLVPAHPDPMESVFAFAARRLGPEAARVLVDAMVSGIYAGDSRRLSLSSAFPKLHALEKEHGGLIRGMMALRRKHRRSEFGPIGTLTSFDLGMETLIGALVADVKASGRAEIRTATRASQVRPDDGTESGWEVRLEDGSSLGADAVVVATPAGTASELVRSFDPALADALAAIRSSPVVVTALAYPLEAMPFPLEGFGLLVPRGEGAECLGVLWESSIYLGRAPSDSVLLRVMSGGSHHPEIVERSDREVLDQVKRDLRMTMGVVDEPARVWTIRHAAGIPQYDVGHSERLEYIDARLSDRTGLYLTGNSYRGVSFNHCVEGSKVIARGVAAALIAR